MLFFLDRRNIKIAETRASDIQLVVCVQKRSWEYLDAFMVVKAAVSIVDLRN